MWHSLCYVSSEQYFLKGQRFATFWTSLLRHHQFSLHHFSVAPSDLQQVYKIFKIILSKYVFKLLSFCVHVGRILSYVLPTVGNGEMRLKLLLSLKS